MRDETFYLFPNARLLGRAPFRIAFVPEAPATAIRRWKILDAADEPCGHARTRAGARAGVRALHAVCA